MSDDPFRHLPHLRERVTPPAQSALRPTAEVMAAWDASARAAGRPADWRLPDAAIEASRRAVLGGRDGSQDLWVFAYGSLMWDPGLHFAEVRLAELDGFARRFALRSPIGRGTPERPALMLCLEPGPGRCTGLAYRIAADLAEAESAILWRREMLRGSYRPQLHQATTPQGAVEVLVLAANPSHDDHADEQPLAETAATIACATGILGSNRHYLEQLAAQLAALGIVDDYVEQLHRCVQLQADGPPG